MKKEQEMFSSRETAYALLETIICHVQPLLRQKGNKNVQAPGGGGSRNLATCWREC